MKFKDRAGIIEKLNLWEKKYPVETWMIEGVHIWPILKKDIFFNSYRKLKVSPVKVRSRKSSLLIKIINKIYKKPKAWVGLKRFKIKEVQFLFSGAPSHRVDWENSQFNRYFDPMMDYLEKKGENSYLLEYNKVELKDVYKSSRVINLTEVLPVFTKRLNFDKTWNHLMDSPEFTDFFNEMKEEPGLSQKVLKNTLLKNVQGILNWAALYEYFLMQTKSEYIFGLCYYSNAIYGMNLAAKKLGVVSIDMQHGGQGNLHFAYHFGKTPKEGYNILPEKFWVWDNLSFDQIAKWTDNKNHFAILGGNPWIEFLRDDIKAARIFKDSNKPMVLFTLQPLKPIIDDYFLEVISLTCQKYNWWLRLHPRMIYDEISELKSKLKEFQIEELVNIEDASREPLPLLLKQCRLHVSKYSGSIAEAALMQKPSLIIDKIGVKSFEDLIDRKMAVACLTNNPPQIMDLIEIILNKPDIKMVNHAQEPTGYKVLMDQFIKIT